MPDSRRVVELDMGNLQLDLLAIPREKAVEVVRGHLSKGQREVSIEQANWFIDLLVPNYRSLV